MSARYPSDQVGYSLYSLEDPEAGGPQFEPYPLDRPMGYPGGLPDQGPRQLPSKQFHGLKISYQLKAESGNNGPDVFIRLKV
jgi:hypothetical protein